MATFARPSTGRSTRSWIVALAILLPAATGAAASEAWVAKPIAIAPGSSAKIVTTERVGGFRRSFRLHVPAGYDHDSEPQRRYPLVVALHGGVATGAIFERQSGLSAVADREGFFVVYPNGIGIFSLLRHWNGGYCCARAAKIGLDDPAFLDRVRGWVSAHYPIDAERHYVIGYSNGGMLAYWYAATRADQLAGLGIWASSLARPVDGGDGWATPRPAVALPAIVSHGSADPRLPYRADDERDPTERGGLALLGAVGSAAAWAEANGCAAPPATSMAADGALEILDWCATSDAPVRFLGVDDWGHEWPGPKRTTRLEPQLPLAGFDLADRMWAFFDRRK